MQAFCHRQMAAAQMCGSFPVRERKCAASRRRQSRRSIPVWKKFLRYQSDRMVLIFFYPHVKANPLGSNTTAQKLQKPPLLCKKWGFYAVDEWKTFDIIANVRSFLCGGHMEASHHEEPSDYKNKNWWNMDDRCAVFPDGLRWIGFLLQFQKYLYFCRNGSVGNLPRCVFCQWQYPLHLHSGH